MEFNKPDPLKMTGNLAKNFRNFRQQLQIYFDATESHTKKEATQVAILLTIWVRMAYCIPRRNKTMELYQFFTRKQLDGEPFDKFYSDLHKEIQARLLREELTLEKTVKHCQITEQSEVN
ncbi:Uncharacterized protein FWK35_00026629, partial [Aphis craccivora]